MSTRSCLTTRTTTRGTTTEGRAFGCSDSGGRLSGIAPACCACWPSLSLGGHCAPLSRCRGHRNRPRLRLADFGTLDTDGRNATLVTVKALGWEEWGPSGAAASEFRCQPRLPLPAPRLLPLTARFPMTARFSLLARALAAASRVSLSAWVSRRLPGFRCRHGFRGGFPGFAAGMGFAAGIWLPAPGPGAAPESSSSRCRPRINPASPYWRWWARWGGAGGMLIC